MLKIVLTGGPSSGKTSMTTELKKFYGEKVYICKEAAEMLFRGGFPRQNTPEGVSEQQYAIFHLQKALERIAPLENPNAEIIIFDRGLLDGLCYWSGPWSGFEHKMHMHIEPTRNHYDLVVQLGVAGPEDYQNTAFRPEDQETSLKMEQSLTEIWSPHTNYKFLDYNESWSQKVSSCIQIIENFRQDLRSEKNIAAKN